MMILQVYAMWNQSKMILYILLFIYVPQIIVNLVFLAEYYNTHLTGMYNISQYKLQAELKFLFL